MRLAARVGGAVLAMLARLLACYMPGTLPVWRAVVYLQPQRSNLHLPTRLMCLCKHVLCPLCRTAQMWLGGRRSTWLSWRGCTAQQVGPPALAALGWAGLADHLYWLACC
jgi:hypothetical protein